MDHRLPHPRRRYPIGTFSFLLALLLAWPAAQPVHAAEATTVASAFDPGDPIDARVLLSYTHSSSKGLITREVTGRFSDQISVERLRELRFSQTRHLLTPRVEVGVWRDLQLHMELPIVLADDRTFSFAQADGPCGDPPELNCVTRNNSTIVADGLLDRDALQDGQVVIGSSGAIPGGLVLPTRSGVDQLNFGLTWAVLNQARDPTKPTWAVGLESRIAVGSAMEYGAGTAPTANTSVGRGIHQLNFWTAVSRRFEYVEPWFSLSYLLPFAASGSLFDKTTFPVSGQRRSGPQHMGSSEMGVEVKAWERPSGGYRINVLLATSLTAHFEGRGYSPIWELFANNAALAGPCHPDPARAAEAGFTPWENGTYCANSGESIPYPGITHIENYLNLSGRIGVQAEITRYAQLQLGTKFGYDQAHFITFGDTGSTRDANQRLDTTDPLQVNPMFRPLIDSPGRRLRVEDTFLFDLTLSVAGRF